MIGYSTGALAYSDFREGIGILRNLGLEAVELSALRQSELEPLVDAIPSLDLRRSFRYISFHAPSAITPGSEEWLVRCLAETRAFQFPIIVHPNVISTPNLWQQFGEMLLIENMDKRKPIGRTADELQSVFDLLPEARMCFDIGHARQVDPTMCVAAEILKRFGERIVQMHVSEVDTESKHRQLTSASKLAFSKVAALIPRNVPVILEATEIHPTRRMQEARFAEEVLYELLPA